MDTNKCVQFVILHEIFFINFHMWIEVMLAIVIMIKNE
jgi:hypothetical protein